MKLKYVNLLVAMLRIIISLLCIALIISLFKGYTTLIELSMLPFLIVSAILDYRLKRCPNCGNHLGKSLILNKKCHYCSHSIDPNAKVNFNKLKKRQEEFNEINN